MNKLNLYNTASSPESNALGEKECSHHYTPCDLVYRRAQQQQVYFKCSITSRVLTLKECFFIFLFVSSSDYSACLGYS